MQDVRTYINSGNVVFGYEKMNTQVLADKLERAIEHEFGFPVPTIVRSEQEMSETVGVIENEWLNDAVQGSTGNIPSYEEFEITLFDIFQKYRDNGYPNMVIVSLICDGTKLPMTIPAMFDKWNSQQ